MTGRYPTPRKRIVDALQRCSSGLGIAALAQIGYGSAGRAERHAVHQVVWRLRPSLWIEGFDGAEGYAYRLIEAVREAAA
jgi:hypothetical protein